MTNIRPLFALAVVLAAFAAPAQEPAAPDSAAQTPARPRRVHPMAALMANPAAWNEPEHFIAVVNEGNAADPAWLADFVPSVVKYCQLRMEIVTLDAAPDASPSRASHHRARFPETPSTTSTTTILPAAR